MVCSARLSISGETSFKSVRYPAAAATWAMPLPIMPDPITAIARTSIGFASFSSPGRLRLQCLDDRIDHDLSMEPAVFDKNLVGMDSGQHDAGQIDAAHVAF